MDLIVVNSSLVAISKNPSPYRWQFYVEYILLEGPLRSLPFDAVQDAIDAGYAHGDGSYVVLMDGAQIRKVTLQ